LINLVFRGAQQAPVPHGSSTEATVSAHDTALVLPPTGTSATAGGGAAGRS
jgi:hypothetical protein